MKKGFFITFEGGEGTGKSTQSRLLSEALSKEGFDVIQTREPGGSVGAEEIRSLLVNGDAGKWDSKTELLLFMAARRNHLTTKIWPAMAENKVVICDRFLDSTIAYQGYGRGKNPKLIQEIKDIYYLIADDFQPDLTFILDIDPVVGLKRSMTRSGNTEQRFESMDLSFHQNLRKGFLELSRQDNRYVIIDATDSVENIHAKILTEVKKRMPIGEYK